MTLTDLQEMALRQQKQIEINQQLLLAKEKRLKTLKLEEQRSLALLSHQGNLLTTTTTNQENNNNNNNNSQKIENLKQNVLGQELKIFKLKQLRNQILEYKLSNSNMYSELDLIKSLFTEKERELVKAIGKVSELTKQIDQLRKIKNLSTTTTTSVAPSKPQAPGAQEAPLSPNVSELEKLRQELQIRNKLNEQQSKKILLQHEHFNKKQMEVLALDKRIEELKSRIALKRSKLSEQMGAANSVFSPSQRSTIVSDFNSLFIDQQQPFTSNNQSRQNKEPFQNEAKTLIRPSSVNETQQNRYAF